MILDLKKKIILKYINIHIDMIIKINLNFNKEFNKNIDGIVYINLKHRTQRNQHMKNELELYNFNTEKIYRIDAVHNKDCGHLGCCQNHIKAIEFAQLNKWKNILIFEDDSILLKIINMFLSFIRNI